MSRIRLIHWHEAEARDGITALEQAGFRVDHGPFTDPSALTAITDSAPEAIVIDLARRPAQGRDLAIWLRHQRSTRQVPLALVGGEAEKVDKIRQLLPDALYSDWRSLPRDLPGWIADPPRDPVVPGSLFAGYSGTPLPKKLGIKPGYVVALLGAPPELAWTLGPLPDGAQLRPSGRGRRDLTLCFVKSLRELRRRIPRLVEVSEQGHVWIAWPKKASGLATDVTQTDVRRTGLDAGLVDFKICAIDETWSGLCFALRRSR